MTLATVGLMFCSAFVAARIQMFLAIRMMEHAQRGMIRRAGDVGIMMGILNWTLFLVSMVIMTIVAIQHG